MVRKIIRRPTIRTVTRGGKRDDKFTSISPIQVAVLCIVLVMLYMLFFPDTQSIGLVVSQTDLLENTKTGAQVSHVEIPDIHVAEDDSTLPSAKSLLYSPPPFDNSKIFKLADTLAESPNTVVTGYFRVPSKFHAGKYDGWMKNMLSLQDAMVVFTEIDVVDQVKRLRSHALNRTVIVVMGIDDLPIGNLYTQEFWQDQLDRDPEKRIHKSYQLFWIWLSKSWLTMQAIRLNFYNSDLFMWSDIGCFRDGKYNGKMMIQHRDMIPPTEMIQMAHHKPNPPSVSLFNDKYKQKPNFYHSGSQFAAYKDTWTKFHTYFLETIDAFLEKKMIIVEDQAVLQSVCLTHPEICVYVPFSQVNDNHYFGLRYVVHKGGKYRFWRYKKE